MTIDMSADGTAANDQPFRMGVERPSARPHPRPEAWRTKRRRDLVEAAQQRLQLDVGHGATSCARQMPVAVVEESTGSADVSAVRRSGGSGSRAAGVISSSYSAQSSK